MAGGSKMPIGETLDRILTQVKGLTITNVIVMIMLFIVAMPAYVGWRVINDEKLMAIVFSNYQEVDVPTACTLVVAQPAGGQRHWYIRNLFTERNREIWYAAVRLSFMPDTEAMEKYCNALDQIIDYARDPVNELEPLFPGSPRAIFPPDSTIEIRRERAENFNERSSLPPYTLPPGPAPSPVYQD